MRNLGIVNVEASLNSKTTGFTLIANGAYKNYTYRRVNQWISNPYDSSWPVWQGHLEFSWLDANQKPVDINGKTYPVLLERWLVVRNIPNTLLGETLL